MGGLFQGGPPSLPKSEPPATGRLATILTSEGQDAPHAPVREVPDVGPMPGAQLAQALPSASTPPMKSHRCCRHPRRGDPIGR